MNITIYKQTDDDWHPSFECKDLKLVRLKFHQLRDKTWRVSAWGRDNYALEKDFAQESDAVNTYLQLIGMAKVNMVDLKALGFEVF